MKITFKSLFLLSALGLLLISSPANTAIIHNNFGSGDSFNASNFWRASTFENPSSVLPGKDLASPFTPSGNDFFLDQIEIAVRLEAGPNLLDVWIMSDNSNSPGSILESFDFAGDVPGSADIISKNSVSRPVLNAGTKYWIALSTASGDPNNTSVDWYLTDPEVLDTMAFRNPEGGSWSAYTTTVSAFRISGTPVPIPGAIWLLSSGLIGLIGLRRKFKK
jgi:hypothetical protein